jgi:hypothetical protein
MDFWQVSNAWLLEATVWFDRLVDSSGAVIAIAALS